MIPNIDPSQIYPVKAQINPQSIAAAGNATSAWTQVPVNSKWLYVVLNAGALGGGSEQIDVLQATSSGGANSKALSTGLISAVTTNNGTTTAVLDLEKNMDINNGFNFVQIKVTNTGGTGALVGASAIFGPAAFVG